MAEELKGDVTTGWRATTHWRRVRQMMLGFGQAAPEALLSEPSPELLKSRLMLNLEELLEQIRDAGFELRFTNNSDLYPEIDIDALAMSCVRPPDMVKLLDGITDLSVTNTGFFVALGVPDSPFLEEVDANNLLKIATGKLNTETGKFEKTKDHPAPDIAGVLKKLEGGN